MRTQSLFKLAWPIFIEQALIIMVGVVNVYILSRYDSSAAAAVEGCTQVLWNVFLVFAVISLGTSVLVAQNVGAGNRERIDKTAAVSLLFSLGLGLFASVGLTLFGEELLLFLGLSEGLLAHAKTYLLLVGGFVFLDALLFSSDAILKGFGRTRQCLAVTATMNVLNLCGSAVLGLGLFGCPPLGVLGVALAAVGSKAVAVALVQGYLFTRLLKPAIFRHLLTFPFLEMRQVLKIGFPAAMESMSYTLSQTVLMALILSYLGSEAYVARTYAWSVIKMAFLFSLAIGQANVIMIGQLVGAGRFDEAARVGMRNFRIAFGAAWVLGLGLFIGRTELMRIFTAEEAIVSLGALVFMIDAFLEPGRTFNIVLISGLRGAGDVQFPVVMAVLSMWSVNIGLGYYLGVVLGYGLPGIWAAMLVDEWIRGLAMLWRWRSGAWRSKALV